ncbi:3-hydroxyacyl-CoA dehydrogenase/enoyl-CoA hydratase family protein [Halosolutus gelatinilyticus]|uniref:3-hydroxyacyl-CoA dehydrogenase/enoyl-CoA hydratase family protein n=1 Tax=Halosolutus gelatinilyticus TaxID=2931975 RepID=UPI001FF2EF00|nr:3-hydroxyacyl-CoA dehydrogenase NAD-binding domain-containing protein [Halosolutus gelatinilyticus]
MGHGIAELSAIAGYEVSLRDIEEPYVEDGYEQLEWSVEKLTEKGQLGDDPVAVLERVRTTTDLDEAVSDADIVIEAIPEDLGMKRNLFEDVEDATEDDAILATNTSSLRVSDIAEPLENPERFCGLHFFNPPVKMDLVEVVSGERTADDVVDAADKFVESLDKRSVLVRKDVPEFVVNNVLVPFMEEAAWMFDEGEAEARQADAAMVFRRGYPMGPFELADFGGLDVLAHSREQWKKSLPDCVETRVENDELGRKTGLGFYDYEDGGVDYEPGDGDGFDTLRVEARMVNEAARLVGQDVADPEDVDIAMRLGGGLPEGTCRTGDKLGLDRALETVESLYEETGAARYEPADHLVELVEAGHTGEDAGKGFYDYADGGPYHYVTHTLDDGVLEVTFDREERLNALSTDMLDEVQRLLESVDTNEVACVTFEGAGDRAFSAGADITGFTIAEPTDLMDVDEAVETIYEFERPTVAKVDGLCLGGGFEIILACDIRIATKGSKLGSPEINLGLIPGGGGTQRLVRLVGEARTKELIFKGEQISAERAADWGILNRAVPDDEFEETVNEFVTTIANGPQTALKAAKQVINGGQNASLNTAIAMESQAFGLLATTDDMLEGVEAFTHDRDPQFD